MKASRQALVIFLLTQTTFAFAQLMQDPIERGLQLCEKSPPDAALFFRNRELPFDGTPIATRDLEFYMKSLGINAQSISDSGLVGKIKGFSFEEQLKALPPGAAYRLVYAGDLATVAQYYLSASCGSLQLTTGQQKSTLHQILDNSSDSLLRWSEETNESEVSRLSHNIIALSLGDTSPLIPYLYMEYYLQKLPRGEFRIFAVNSNIFSSNTYVWKELKTKKIQQISTEIKGASYTKIPYSLVEASVIKRIKSPKNQ